MITVRIKSILDKNSKYYFVKHLNTGSRLLDVGCGNHSASKLHLLNKNILIEGIDIEDYNIDETDKRIMQNYYLTTPTAFNSFIKSIPQKYDAIICSHVLEHVQNYSELTVILLNKLQIGGLLYLSFPAALSVDFPSRAGTLNFWDDTTHVQIPQLSVIEELCRQNNAVIIKKALPNKGALNSLLGMLVEPISRLRKKVLPFTWNFWGFENVLVINKN